MTSVRHQETFDFIYAKLLKNKDKIKKEENIKCLLPNNTLVDIGTRQDRHFVTVCFGNREVAKVGLIEPSFFNKNPCFFIWSLGCEPRFKCRGYASIALLTVIALGKMYGHKYTLLSVSKSNINALRLYRSLGYTPRNRSQSSFLMVAKI
jgi:ribosomal protein S18 acetylase RimI-like enzyme